MTLPNKPNRKLPALTPDRLKLFQLTLNQQFKPKVVDAIVKIMQAALDPNAESAESAVKELSRARRQAVEQHHAALGGHFEGLVRRGNEMLSALSDDEWNALRAPDIDLTIDSGDIASEPPL